MSDNLERLEKAGLIDGNKLTQEQKKHVDLLTPDEVACLISAACTLGFELDEDSGHAAIL